ncbi:MAG: MoxR family ATPase [Planctomycetia bacterium]|nr:MoxR family ATPase [Planctomycetia bacterium]
MSAAELPAEARAVQELSTAYRQLTAQIGQAVVGQQAVIEQLLIALFGRGHCLLVGVPGLAKTLLVSTVAKVLHLSFKRIQFTPDLMPSDITGTDILQEDPQTGRRKFVFLPGPVFANLVLADEINRTPPKTQAALLEAMQEHHVTAGAHTFQLPQPFFVLATQNPIEQEGTYPLPEAQLDRFMFNIVVGYPSRAEEVQIMKQTTGTHRAELKPLLSGEQILKMQELVRQVVAAEHVFEYAADLVRATRPRDAGVPKFIPELVAWGAGPRAAQYLILGAKARAIIQGRLHATTEDVQAVAHPVLRHRLVTTFNADAEGITTDDIVTRLLQTVPLPQQTAAAKVKRA